MPLPQRAAQVRRRVEEAGLVLSDLSPLGIGRRGVCFVCPCHDAYMSQHVTVARANESRIDEQYYVSAGEASAVSVCVSSSLVAWAGAMAEKSRQNRRLAHLHYHIFICRPSF